MAHPVDTPVPAASPRGSPLFPPPPNPPSDVVVPHDDSPLPPRPLDTQSADEDDDDVYHYPSTDVVEDIECYQEGGFHPVHLGDTFENQRFRVVHKLGNGGFATVWLARDIQLNIYVSLKIHKAESYGTCNELRFLEQFRDDKSNKPGRNSMPTLLHHFTINGPNGTHLCLVTSVGGPSIKSLSSEGRRLSVNRAQSTARKLVEAVQYLHDLGVCHGDLTAANVLFELADFDSWSEKQLYERLGQPWIDAVSRWDEKPPEPAAPKYLVDPIEFGAIDFKYLTENIQLIDFGEAFFTKDPPTKMLNTPLNFLAPEALFELKASERSDDWALACLIYMIRAGKPLFQIEGFGTIDEFIPQLMRVLGPLPNEWQRIFFDEDGMPYRVDEEDDDQKDKSVQEEEEEEEGPEPLPVIELVRRIEENNVAEILRDDGGGTLEIPAQDGHKELIEGEETVAYLKPRNSKERDRWNYTESTDDEIGHDESTEEGPPKKKKRTDKSKISEDEVLCLHDLLNKVIRYNPEERISTSQIASHEWFTRNFSKKQ